MSDDYPYYKLIYNFNLKNILKLYENFKPNVKNKNNDIYIYDEFSKTKELNKLTDYFTEKIRVLCKFGTLKSPKEYWQNNKNKIINLYKTNKYENLNDTIQLNYKLCNNFRVSVIITILQIFKPTKYLDISSGWGDRLIGSILYDKLQIYCGCDPNKKLHKYYNQIIKKFKKTKEKYVLIESGFETAKLPNIKFDFCFSSPPFFDLEKYSSYKNDSLTKYNTIELWTNEFLIKSIYKVHKYLKKNSYFILYINNNEYINSKLNEINHLFIKKGMIYFYDTNKKYKGMTIYQKI